MDAQTAEFIQTIERIYAAIGVLAVVGWAVSIGLGFSQGDKKGAPLWGGFLGFMFGPIGVIIVCLADFGPPSPVRKISAPPEDKKPYRGKAQQLPSGDIPADWQR